MNVFSEMSLAPLVMETSSGHRDFFPVLNIIAESMESGSYSISTVKLFYNLFLPIMEPKTTLKTMMEKPPRSFLKDTLVVNLASLISIHFILPSWENFLQSWGLRKTEPQHKQSQTLNPDHISFPIVDDDKKWRAKKWRALSQAVET